jgi:hypothetical protein
MIQNMKGGTMKTDELFEMAVEMLRGHYRTGTNWMRGVAVEDALRIANRTGRDPGDVFADMEMAATETE